MLYLQIVAYYEITDFTHYHMIMIHHDLLVKN